MRTDIARHELPSIGSCWVWKRPAIYSLSEVTLNVEVTNVFFNSTGHPIIECDGGFLNGGRAVTASYFLSGIERGNLKEAHL